MEGREVDERAAIPESVKIETVFLAGSYHAPIPVPSDDVGKNGDDLPNAPTECPCSWRCWNGGLSGCTGAVVRLVLTPVSSPRFTSREAKSHAAVRHSGGVVDTSGLLSCSLLSHDHSALSLVVWIHTMAARYFFLFLFHHFATYPEDAWLGFYFQCRIHLRAC